MPSHWHMVVMLVALQGLLKKRFFNTSFTAAGPLLLFKSSQRFEVEKLSTIPPENFVIKSAHSDKVVWQGRVAHQDCLGEDAFFHSFSCMLNKGLESRALTLTVPLFM